MLTLIGTLLGMIPGLAGIIERMQGKYYDTKVRLVSARLGVDRDVAVKMLSAAAVESHEQTNRLAIFASNKILMFIMVGFATPFIIFVWKVVVVDIVIGSGCIWWTKMCWIGSTDPIKGQVADWATTIITALFGSGTAVTIGKMWFNRDKTGE